MSTDSINRIEGDILNDHAMVAKSAFAAAPDDEEVLREIRKYKTTEIRDLHDQGKYRGKHSGHSGRVTADCVA